MFSHVCVRSAPGLTVAAMKFRDGTVNAEATELPSGILTLRDLVGVGYF